ncbi:MAG: hypothetical protein J6U92_03125 [Clostridia bacterium]|nr:hypothetical protein [Clostridia bacterium]
MMTAIAGIIGFIVGIVRYANSTVDTKNILTPIFCTIIGVIIGGIIDVIVGALSRKKNKKVLFITFFIVTIICLAFTFYAFWSNSAHVLKPLRQIGEGSVLYGLINMILFPLVVFIGYFAKFGDYNVLLVMGYVCVLAYSIILSLIFGYSDLASTEDDHRGKYKVTVDTKTGLEVGERVPLDAYTEALKENALIILIIIVGALFCPFLAFAIGFTICFGGKFEGDSFWKPLVFIGVFTVLCYVALFLLA